MYIHKAFEIGNNSRAYRFWYGILYLKVYKDYLYKYNKIQKETFLKYFSIYLSINKSNLSTHLINSYATPNNTIFANFIEIKKWCRTSMFISVSKSEKDTKIIQHMCAGKFHFHYNLIEMSAASHRHKMNSNTIKFSNFDTIVFDYHRHSRLAEMTWCLVLT